MALNRGSSSTVARTLGAALLAATLSGHLPTSAQAQQDTAVALRPGLIVHPTLGVGYVMMPEGGIAAIDLSSGVTRWSTREAAKPLALVNNLLVAQVEPEEVGSRLELMMLSTEEAGAPVQRGVIDLPPEVRVSIGETLHGTFEVGALGSGGNVIVNWRFVRVPRQGMVVDTAAEAEARAAGPPITGGALQVNLATGEVTRIDTLRAALPPSPHWILPPDERVSDAPAPQYESVDGRHVLSSEVIGDDRMWAKYRWTIYERETGREIGEHRTHVSFAPFVVRDSLLIYETTPYSRQGREEEPAKLRAMSLATGQEAWQVDVREVVYRGPFPP